ncbi:hypothetical protein J7T55_004004 [Diaporthe amygdali]|uniref:uncharacterized protein n=1 Tax=Phomopsis amygdali TaxID=1214568 RepID=UPI0022FE9B89|nr:uncharacterized protein J7T55_004004 [Diaporthe amygdali]KAJ0115835.1 hypothetical protein J7T55_004004 [Diaporthe amygdali]
MSSPSRKRKASPELVSNPFIKKRNLDWSISPPPFRNPDRQHRETDGQGVKAHVFDYSNEARSNTAEGSKDVPDNKVAQDSEQDTGLAAANNTQEQRDGPSGSALIENNSVKITDHLAWFSNLLSKAALQPFPENQPHLPIPTYQSLYTHSFQSPMGAHFVVTQHDHPVAGPHYDLRLQINGDSSCSWAIILPGDPNSRGRTGRATGAGVLRNATETRVHCLWNHLVETASLHTGSLLVWDTGSYEVLRPRRSKYAPVDSQEGKSDDSDGKWHRWERLTQQEKLAKAFSSRKIRLRLNGSRLPRGYALNLRLTKDEDAAGRAKAARPAGTRKRRGRKTPTKKAPETSSDGEDDSGPDRRPDRGGEEKEEEEEYNDGSAAVSKKDLDGISEMEKELRELEDAEVRRTNAYPGAANTIGSVHQRKWFLSLDREACGFAKMKKEGRVWWERQDTADEDGLGSDQAQGRFRWPFYVRGPDLERSIVTGRLGAEILRDEGVVGYVGRKGWKPILR